MYKKKPFRNFKPSNMLSGVLLMMTHAAAMSALYIFGKQLTKSLYPEQIAFLYKFSVLLTILPWCLKGGILKNIKTNKLGLHFTHGALSIAATICFYTALTAVQAIDAAAITYLQNVIVLFAGIFYFKESITFGKIVMITLGIGGALLVTKPGFNQFNSHYTYLFLALAFWSMNNLSVKILGHTERTKAQVFYSTLFGSLLSLPLALRHDWPPFDIFYVKYTLMMALFHLIHIVTFFKAFKLADISAVMPFDYTRLIFTGILGYFFLLEEPDFLSLLGYVLIAIGGIYLIIEEGRKKGWSKEGEKKV